MASTTPDPLEVSQLQVCAVTGRTPLPTIIFDRRSYLVGGSERAGKRLMVSDVTTFHLQAQSC